MKLKIILLIYFMIISSNCYLRKKRDVDLTPEKCSDCKCVRQPKGKNPEILVLDDKSENEDYVFPQSYQSSEKNKAKALTQTIAARTFFYLAFDDNRLKTNFANLAKSLYLIAFNDDKNISTVTNLLNLILDSKINRQIIDKKDNKHSTLSRLFNTLQQRFKEKLKKELDLELNVQKITKEQYEQKIKAEIQPFDVLKHLLKNVSTKAENTRPIEFLGFIGLLGDIGAVIQDHFNREKFTQPPQSQLIATFVEKFPNLETISNNFYKLYSPDKYYESETEKRSKKAERGFCVNNNKEMVLEPRSGILNLGEQADKKIKLTFKKPIGPISWPWQTVPKKLIDRCGTEPWAGHFSGSLYELILMQELLGRESLNLEIDNIDDEKRKLYFATASSFLIATGMHSASEVNWVGKMYLNQGTKGPKAISYDEFMNNYCSSSTEDVSNVIIDITSSFK